MRCKRRGSVLALQVLLLLKRIIVTLFAPAPADTAARNVTFELTSTPAEAAGGPPPPLAQQLKGLFAGLKADAA